jgi:hypothetical protein
MGVNHILFGDELRNELASGFPLLLELLTTLWGGSVNAEDEFVLLISFSERVKSLLRIVEVTTVSEPSDFGTSL